MPNTGTIGISANIGGMSVNRTISRSSESVLGSELSLSPATAGTLTTRTDDDTGVVTLTAGHGLTNGTYDIFWTSGGVNYCRYGADGVVDGNELTIGGVTAGAGTVLPAEDSSVFVRKVESFDIDFDGDDLKMLVLDADYACHVDFQDSGGASVGQVLLHGAEPYIWIAYEGVTAPITGNPVDTISAAAATANATTLKFMAIYTAL